MSNIIIGIDCGLKGGITILDGKNIQIYKMPTFVEQKNKSSKKKNKYDLPKIVSFLELYKDKEVLIAIERQGTRPGEGAVSAFTIGEGYGSLQGLAYAFGFDVHIITPVTWKKHYPELETIEIMAYRQEQKDLKLDTKKQIESIEEYIKNIKDKMLKTKKKKDIKELKNQCSQAVTKLGNKIKKAAKNKAREICKEMYPNMADEFKLVSDDGKAESVLIALYAKDNF